MNEMQYSEENYKENTENKNLRFIASRSDGLGGRMMALLNAMYCSKKFGIPFAFVWIEDPEWWFKKNNADNKLQWVCWGKIKDVFSEDFIQKYCLPKEISEQSRMWRGSYEALEPYKKIKNFRFENLLYYKREIPLGWPMPWWDLPRFYGDINKNEYKATIKECWNEIGFSDEFSEIIKKVDAVVQNKGKFITLHVRSGDVVYAIPSYVYSQKAVAAELPVEVIVRELPYHNIVISGDDLTSLERMIEVSLETLKEKKVDCHGHFVLIAKDLIKDICISNEIQLAFYDCYLLSKGEKIYISSYSNFSCLASLLSETNEIIFYNKYFSNQEQFDIIANYIDKLNLNSAQQAFSYYHLLLLAKELGKTYEEQLKYAEKINLLGDTPFMKSHYGYFLLENNRNNLFSKFINSLSMDELIKIIDISFIKYFQCPASATHLKDFIFGIFAADCIQKNNNFFEEQLKYANKSDLFIIKAYYGYFLLENNKANLFHKFVNSFSIDELIRLMHIIFTDCHRCQVTAKYLKKFLFGILTADCVCKDNNIIAIKHSLTAEEKELFYPIYKNIIFRNKVHLYNFMHRILH